MALGVLAAGFQALEIERILRGDLERSILGHETYQDLDSRAVMTSRLVRNPRCRFDHAYGPPVVIDDLRLAELFSRVPDARGLSVHGARFVRNLGCRRCGAEDSAVWLLVREIERRAPCCGRCGGVLVATGLDLADELPISGVDGGILERRISDFGVQEGDLLLVESRGGLRLFERRSIAHGQDDDLSGTLCVVGLGNIGSNLVDTILRGHPHAIERVILIDPDSYEHGNLFGQRFEACDLGQPKALAQAHRVLRSRPLLSVVAYVARVEDVPPSVFRGSIVAGCVDSRAARQSIAEVAWRMGAPFVDAAVDAGVPAVRLAGYLPGAGNACLECSFLDDDYAAIEQRNGCNA